MKAMTDETGKRIIVFLSKPDLEFLIYMTSDVWITPELKRFKNSLLERAGEEASKKSSERWN